MTSARDIARGAPGGCWWYADVGHAATYERLAEAARGTLDKLDASTLRSMSKELLAKKAKYEGCLKDSGATEMPQEFDSAHAIVIDIAVATCAMQLMYALSADKSLEPRPIIQYEIKLIRSSGLREKECLPPAIYKKAYHILTLPR